MLPCGNLLGVPDGFVAVVLHLVSVTRVTVFWLDKCSGVRYGVVIGFSW
jgi:hypothetical protein